MIYFFLTGVGLGLYAGLSPGPHTAMVIAETLRGGWPAGFQLALAPLVSDTVLVAVTFLMVTGLPGEALSVISVIGGAVMIWMAYGAIRSGLAPAVAESAPGKDGPLFWKGVFTNMLNPHAIVFWMTSGSPLLRESVGSVGWAGPLVFLTGFLGPLVGCKTLLAYGVSRGRLFFHDRAYRWTLAASGGALGLLGLWRMWVGFRVL